MSSWNSSRLRSDPEWQRVVFILISFSHRKSGWEKSSELESCHGSWRSDQVVTARHSFFRSVFFSKLGCGSDNFLYHYNARRFFDGSFLEWATISLIIPRTLLTNIKAYTDNYAQMDKNELPRYICLLVAISAKIPLYASFLRGLPELKYSVM